MTPLEVQKKRQQQLAEHLRVSAPEPLSPRGEAIRILSDGLLELIIQRSRHRRTERTASTTGFGRLWAKARLDD